MPAFVQVCVGLALLIRLDVNAGPQQMGMRESEGGGAVVFFPLVLQPVFLPEPHGSCQSQDFHVKLGCLQKPSAWVRAQEEACKLHAPALGNDKADGWTYARGTNE